MISSAYYVGKAGRYYSVGKTVKFAQSQGHKVANKLFPVDTQHVPESKVI